MKLSELITMLERAKLMYGDLPVLCATDSEINTIGDLFEVQVGKLEEDDEYVNSTVKPGDQSVLLIPAI